MAGAVGRKLPNDPGMRKRGSRIKGNHSGQFAEFIPSFIASKLQR